MFLKYSSQAPGWFTSLVGLLVVVLAFSVIIFLAERLVFGPPVPRGIPLIREPEGARSFSWRTRWAYYTDCKELFREAYQNYVKKGKAVVLPGLGSRIEVILPQSSMRWVMAQPESQLSVGEAFAEMDQIRWSLDHEIVISDPWPGFLVKTDLNRMLETTSEEMREELYLAFDECFGTDTENWKEVDLLAVINDIIAQAASRFTVGLDLCRNKEYLQLIIEMNSLLILNAGLVGASPRVLHPLVGRLINIPMHFKIERVKKMLVPLWKKRIETLRYARDDPSHDEPTDLLQMMVRFCAEKRPEELHNYDLIVRRIIASNFGAVHQTAVQVTNLLLNVVGSDSEYNTMSQLREESNRIIGTDREAYWTKAKTAQMQKSDSACRETLRLNSFGGRAVMRKVIVDGFRTDQGIHLPKGSFISFLGQPAQTDEATLEDATKFDPFRFARMREQAKKNGEGEQPLGFVSTSPEYLPFGHGKHACPGRFLVDFELKMVLAYTMNKYDIKFPDSYKGVRPPNVWMAEGVVTPPGAKIMLRRKK